MALAGAATMLLTLSVGAASADPVTPPTKVVQAGMRLKFDNIAGNVGTCTLGAVGTDASGRKVGITAGHCNPPQQDTEGAPPVPFKGATVRTHVTANNHPVWDWRDVTSGHTASPIGWIRWVSGDSTQDSDQWLRNNIDYMVIEFADNVELSSQVMTVPKYGDNANGTPYDPVNTYEPGPVVTPSVPWFKMNSVFTDSSGNPSTPPLLTAVCHAGAITQQQNSQANTPYDARCGQIIYYGWNQDMYTQDFLQKGDSGGPVWVMNQTAKWVGIVSRYQPGGIGYEFYYVHTTAKKILADLNSKPVGYPGKGFQITNN